MALHDGVTPLPTRRMRDGAALRSRNSRLSGARCRPGGPSPPGRGAWLRFRLDIRSSLWRAANVRNLDVAVLDRGGHLADPHGYPRARGAIPATSHGGQDG